MTVGTQLRNDGITDFSIADTNPNLDEFVMIQRRFEFGENRFAEPGIADHDQGLELVAQAAEMFFLVFAKVHGREV